jgi:3-dehydroquinate synthase
MKRFHKFTLKPKLKIETQFYFFRNHEETWEKIFKNFFPRIGLVIFDKNVYELYPFWRNFFSAKEKYVFNSAGEDIKNWETLGTLLEIFDKVNLKRDSYVLAIGGGTVADLAGLASGLYKRGIRFLHFPTTLLSQVDSSLGGKTGINWNGKKNQVGMFYFPAAVFSFMDFNLTLKSEDYSSGLGEIIKYGVYLDEDILQYLYKKRNKLAERDLQTLYSLTLRCLKLKREVVLKDPLETRGKRIFLNGGHTLGHVLELKETLPHGLAVALSILLEMEWLESLQLENYGRRKDEYKKLIFSFFPELKDIYNNVDIELLLEKIKDDKKNLTTGLVIPLPFRKRKSVKIKI